MAGRARKRRTEVDQLPLAPDEGSATVEVAPGETESYDREELLKAYLASLCGSVTEHARKLPRGVSTDLSKVLARVVADDINRLLGKKVYQRVARPRLKNARSKTPDERAAHKADLQDWKRLHEPKHLTLDEIWVGEVAVSGGIKTQQLDIVGASPKDDWRSESMSKGSTPRRTPART